MTIHASSATVLIKLGGSLITDKTSERVFRSEVMRRVAMEIRRLLDKRPNLQLIIGHGSGSFGHVAAKQYNTKQGVTTAEEWYGFARVAHIATELNQLVTGELLASGVPAFSIQPSASAQCDEGVLHFLGVESIIRALQHRLVPVIFGDVSFDDTLGGTIISTETIFAYLVANLPVKQIILLGEVEGVFDSEGEIIPLITDANFPEIAPVLGASRGTDVTGGMLSKVTDMLQLSHSNPGLEIRICDGRQPGIINQIFNSQFDTGTIIRSQ